MKLRCTSWKCGQIHWSTKSKMAAIRQFDFFFYGYAHIIAQYMFSECWVLEKFIFEVSLMVWTIFFSIFPSYMAADFPNTYVVFFKLSQFVSSRVSRESSSCLLVLESETINLHTVCLKVLQVQGFCWLNLRKSPLLPWSHKWQCNKKLLMKCRYWIHQHWMFNFHLHVFSY